MALSESTRKFEPVFRARTVPGEAERLHNQVRNNIEQYLWICYDHTLHFGDLIVIPYGTHNVVEKPESSFELYPGKYFTLNS